MTRLLLEIIITETSKKKKGLILFPNSNNGNRISYFCLIRGTGACVCVCVGGGELQLGRAQRIHLQAERVQPAGANTFPVQKQLERLCIETRKTADLTGRSQHGEGGPDPNLPVSLLLLKLGCKFESTKCLVLLGFRTEHT